MTERIVLASGDGEGFTSAPMLAADPGTPAWAQQRDLARGLVVAAGILAQIAPQADTATLARVLLRQALAPLAASHPHLSLQTVIELLTHTVPPDYVEPASRAPRRQPAAPEGR